MTTKLRNLLGVHTLAIILIALVFWPTAGSAAADSAAAGVGPDSAFGAHLSGDQEVPPVTTAAHGKATFVLDSDMTTLHYRVEVGDIVSITAAHIHSAPAGSNGSVIAPLFTGTGLFDPDNPVSGMVTLTPAQVAELKAGNTYVNVHTSAHPSGEIRGQIMPHIAMTMGAIMNGAGENPPVDTAASGVIRFTKVNTYTYDYDLAVNDIISVTAAHIHAAPAGSNGSVVTPLNTTGLVPNSPTAGTVSFSAHQLLDFLSGYQYVNVHTSAHGSGEIRGQIEHAMITPFHAMLSGGQEVPPATSSASGHAVVVVADDWATAHFRVLVQDISGITAAHIHEAPAGSNGPVAHPLFTGAGVFDPANPAEGMLTFDIDDLADLVAGRFYVNVHTSTTPSGEIRGQLGPHPLSAMEALLNGANHTPPVSTTRTGRAVFTFDEYRNVHFMLDLSDLTDVTAAHVHLGYSGTNGPVVFPLFSATRALLAQGMVTPTAPQLLDMLTGKHYVNVHTGANPAGAIRGQIVVRAAPTAVALTQFAGEGNGLINAGILTLTLTLFTTALYLLNRRRRQPAA